MWMAVRWWEALGPVQASLCPELAGGAFRERPGEVLVQSRTPHSCLRSLQTPRSSLHRAAGVLAVTVNHPQNLIYESQREMCCSAV